MSAAPDRDRDAPSYSVARGDAQRDRTIVWEIWERNLDRSVDRAGKFEWFYRNNPFGPAMVQLLRQEPGGTCVGIAAVGRRRMQYHGQDMRGGVLADMAVDVGHRTLGPALMLQEALARDAAGEFDFVYGYPNRAASAVMRRLGYPILGRIPRYVRILRHHTYLERRLPRVLARPLGWLLDGVRQVLDGMWLRSARTPRAEWSDRADERMDELWRRTVPMDVLIAPRDQAWLRWRFDKFPGTPTRYLTLCQPGSSSVQAWFACQAEGTSLHVRDFWSADAAVGVGSHWIAALVRAARSAGFASLDMEYAAPADRLANWTAQGFMEREHRFVVGRWIGAMAARPIPHNFHFTSADEDV